MRLSLKVFRGISALALAIVPSMMMVGQASAQPMRFDGSYLGAGVTAGVTNGGANNDAASTGGNIQGRFTTSAAPVSIRGALLFNGDNANIIPTVTYDQRVTDNANVYAGVGYSFVDKNNQPAPLGNRDSLVLTAGAEAAVTKDIVVYGDAKYGLNAYENSSADALSLQAGVGYRF